MKRRPRVVLADDHPVFLFGLAAALTKHGFDVVAQVGDGAAAVAAIEKAQPDLVVSDVRMPVMDGLDLCRHVRDSGWYGPLVLLTTYDSPGMVRRARRAGATAFVAKDVPMHVLVAVLERALRDPSYADFPSTEGPELTLREEDVLEGIAMGLSLPEVAARLGIATATAKEYLATVYGKLGVRDRVTAVVEARRLGLLSDEP